MYSNCDSIEDACRVFSEIQFPNVFTWNTMIGGLGNHGRISQAEKLFDEMPVRDSVSWTSMMSAYFNNGKPEQTIKLFVSMIKEINAVPDQFSVTCVMKACGSLGYLTLATQLHGFVEKCGSSVASSLIDMYIKCGAVAYADHIFLRIPNPSLFCWNSMIYGYSKLSGIDRSLQFFDDMPEHDAVSWTTIISLLSQNGYEVLALDMFVEMWNQGFRPNSMTYSSVLSACASLYDFDWGRHLHARILRSESVLDVYTGGGLIDMYAKCGFLKFARWIFNSLTERNVVSWTSLIMGVSRFGSEEEALLLFNQMRKVPLAPDEFTVATVFGVCTSCKESFLGMQLHGYTVKTGIEYSIPVGNAVITMYAKCGNLKHAKLAFESMPLRDIITWTSMINAFSQNNDVETAHEYFDQMAERNIITWNSMMATYVQKGFWEEGLKLYITMLRQGIMPDWITFATSLSACADSALLQLGKQLIAQAEKLGFGSDVSVANSAITLYSRCGQIDNAERVFDSTSCKCLVSWNSILSGYAQNGLGSKVIEMYESMLKGGCQPDHISYVSILMGCSHAGLVQEGRHYFNSMTKDHGISPTHEHFTCMVDLLGRAGLLEEAKNLINGMPFKPNGTVWGALLSACHNYGDAKLAEFAASKLLELDLEDSGSYILISNMYSDSGKQEGVVNVRKMMREKGIQKNPGCSWIEVNNRINVFSVYDSNHPQIGDVIKMLEYTARETDDATSCLLLDTFLDTL
ncbi:hypothetical protein Ancab_007064 [Ancistrocladus abbreviatus]